MAKKPKHKLEEFPEPGSVFVAPMANGRFCAGRVLRRQFSGGANAAMIAATPWIGNAAPAIDLPVLKEILVLNHHAWKDQPEILWVGELMPPEFTIIGTVELSLKDMAVECLSYGRWQFIPGQVLLQWRWDHDREQLLREEAEEKIKADEERRIAAERRQQYLGSLTLDTLVAQTWFPTWDPDSVAAVEESRNILARLVGDLQALPQLTSGAVKKRLKQSVKEFNRLDAKLQFIETVEREDICEALEQIACATRFPQLVDQIGEWREW
jgi:hypothetical protein